MIYKRKQAIALTYDTQTGSAPHVAASGKGLIAERILEKAIENNVPIMEDESLVELLGQLNINEKIPDTLYHAVAEVFAFIYKADQSLKK